jgi:hypothetical protein
MKETTATSKGTAMTAKVKLKFSVKRENMKMPLGGIGMSGSCKGFALLSLL